MREAPPGVHDLSIRHASVDDAPLVAELGARIFAETFAPSNRAEDIRRYVAEAFSVERVRTELADPSSLTLIAEVAGAAAGYARLFGGEAPEQVSGPAPVELVRLYVDSAFHGTGVGARLMQACLDAARELGYDTMYFGVWEHNPRAQAFYRKWGFERCGEHAFQLGDETQTDWLMARRI